MPEEYLISYSTKKFVQPLDMKAKYKLSKWTTMSKPRNGKVIINKKNVMQKLVKKLKRLCRQSKRP